MKHQLWLGTEDALMQLIETERLFTSNFVALTDRRQAFLDGLEEGDDEARIGEYLVTRQAGGAAIIKISGSLTNGYRWHHPMLDGRVTSYEAIGDALDIVAADDSISQVVLAIHSGGGAVTGLDAVSDKIYRLDRVKPVRAHTSTSAFSAAYWIAASTREVVATRMAEVGSIGTLMVHQSVARMAQEMGIDFTVFRAGKYKAMGLPMEELTDEAKAYLQADLEKANRFFLEHVSRRRNLLVSEQHRWGDGKTFFAGEAQDAGLIDRIAPLEEVISASGANHRRYRMFISDEKRAQIAAGARPQDVLTTDELTQYQAELSEPEAEASEPETEAAEGATETEREASEPEAEGEPEPQEPTASLSADITQLLRDNGKLEARLEAAEAKVSAAEERLATAQAQIAGLQEIGKLAVHNLQVALGLPKETPGSAEGLVTAYNDLQTRMAERFKVGRQSQAPRDQDDHTHIPLAFRQRSQ